jgi:lysozyme family protein
MQHPFLQLQDEYTRRLASLKITRAAESLARAKQILHRPEVISNFEPVQQALGIPMVWMICSFERESSLDFHTSPAQGDRWDRVSTHVPAGVGPFPSFTAAAIWSYRHDGLDKNSAPWSWVYMCWAWEKFNGFGPRNHARVSGYVFSGTDQYDPPAGRAGKYIDDGVWSPAAVDQQLGCVPLAINLVSLEPRLAVPGFPRALEPAPIIVTPVPVGVGGGAYDTTWIQHTLNMLGGDGTPLREDGIYGRFTRTAVRAFQAAHGLVPDGLAGPETTKLLWTLAY